MPNNSVRFSQVYAVLVWSARSVSCRTSVDLVFSRSGKAAFSHCWRLSSRCSGGCLADFFFWPCSFGCLKLLQEAFVPEIGAYEWSVVVARADCEANGNWGCFS